MAEEGLDEVVAEPFELARRVRGEVRRCAEPLYVERLKDVGEHKRREAAVLRGRVVDALLEVGSGDDERA